MIRNVVLGRLKGDADTTLLDQALAGIEALDVDGMLAVHTGRDLRLRDGGWDYAITADFVDEAAYRRYDADAEHNRLRQELFAVVSGEIARVQFTVPD